MLILGGQRLPTDYFIKEAVGYEEHHRANMYLGFTLDSYMQEKEIRVHLCFGRRELYERSAGKTNMRRREESSLQSLRMGSDGKSGIRRIGCQNTRIMLVCVDETEEFEYAMPHLVQSSEIARIKSDKTDSHHIFQQFTAAGFETLTYLNIQDKQTAIEGSELDLIKLKFAKVIEAYFESMEIDRMLELQKLSSYKSYYSASQSRFIDTTISRVIRTLSQPHRNAGDTRAALEDALHL